MDDGVAVADAAVDAVDDRRRDELVVLAARVAASIAASARRRVLAHPVDDRVVAALVRSQRLSRSIA